MLFTLMRGHTAGEGAMLILVFVVAVLCAIIPHEVAHGYAALKMGDPTAKLHRRLSFNPMRHLEPMGALAFIFIGIGWAKPVPVNPFNFRNFRRGNFWVSIAGVLTNLGIAFFASLFLYIIFQYGLDGDVRNATNNIGMFALYHFFLFLTAINIMLMIFNLLPIFPLDGYNILVSFTKPNNRFMEFNRRYSMVILLVVLLTLMFTGAIGYERDGVIYGFFWFWGLMF